MTGMMELRNMPNPTRQRNLRAFTACPDIESTRTPTVGIVKN